MMKQKIIICLLIILSLNNKFIVSQKVAIIGKGLGGALCSYFLHKMIPGIKIDIYNHQPEKITFFYAILFNSHNTYINELIKEKNIRSANTLEYGIIKEGDKFYNLDIKKFDGYEAFHSELTEYVMQQLEIFKQVYNFQKNNNSFKTVRQLLNSLSTDFENYFVNETTESLLFIKNPLIAANPGIQKYIKNQLAVDFLNTNAHGFAGLALLMFSEIIEKFQLIDLKKTDIFIKSLFHEDDNTIEKDVSIIVRENNQNYVVPHGGNPTPYDFIILATTMAADLIQFEGFTDPVKIFKYRNSHTLYMTGRLLKKFRKVSKNLISIFNIENNQLYTQIPCPDTTMFSIAGLQLPSKSDISEYVKLHKIKNYCAIHTVPDYSVKDDESLQDAKFELAENIYNAHALHSLNILHEMLAIGAKNIALLIKNRTEEIGKFVDNKQNNCGYQRKDISCSIVVGQTTNPTFDERSINSERVSLSNILRQRINETIDGRRTGGRKPSSSTVRQRTSQLKSGKSNTNRRQ